MVSKIWKIDERKTVCCFKATLGDKEFKNNFLLPILIFVSFLNNSNINNVSNNLFIRLALYYHSLHYVFPIVAILFLAFCQSNSYYTLHFFYLNLFNNSIIFSFIYQLCAFICNLQLHYFHPLFWCFHYNFLQRFLEL